MQRLHPALQHYAWGSPTAIPQILADVPDGRPVAEAWFGAHPSAPSLLAGGEPLDKVVSADPRTALGPDVVSRFGAQLPYLLKLIAAAQPLSLQVHPSIELAHEGFAAEDARGVPIDAPARSYRDRNHKPELVFALSRFEALVGFRAPRRAAEILEGLDHDVARRLHRTILADPTSEGMRAAFTRLVSHDTRPTADEVRDLALLFRQRRLEGSPSPRTDHAVELLAAAYPGDPGAITAVLLNPVTLQPGEAFFVPAGAVHAYISGLAVELMANSDNVLRAGLTAKHVDVPELLRAVDCVAAPPIRIAPEHAFDATDVFYAPVEDFELSVTRAADARPARVPGAGPRVLLCLEGDVRLSTEQGEELVLVGGQAAFVAASDGPVRVQGSGRVVQASVP